MRLVVASGIVVLAILVAIWAMQRKLIYFPSSCTCQTRTPSG